MSDAAFGATPQTTVVTSSYVTIDKMPILYVSHEDDEEGGSLWQFHCGNGDYSASKIQLVRLETVTKLDRSLAEVADLPMGCSATRCSPGSEWVIERAKDKRE